MSEMADLLDAVEATVRRYVRLQAEEHYTAVTLWAAHAHAIRAADTSPRLILRSPEKESGKTRTLEVLELLTPAPLFTVNASVSAIFRLLKEEQSTLLVDECDAIFGPKANGTYEDLRALLNAGHRRGATVARVVGEGSKMRTQRFPVFAATSLAAIGDLPDTVTSRAIVIPMRRRAPDEPVESFRRRRAEAAATELRDGLASWAATASAILADADPTMPEGITDRAADCWEPLLAIAELAGSEWTQRARDAAVFVVKGRLAQDQSVGVHLLAAVRDVMADADRLSSADLCARLNIIEEAPWGGWNDGRGIGPRDLARRLKEYAIEPRVIRLPNGTPHGYLRDGFTDAWIRYLRSAPLSATSATSATAKPSNSNPVADVAPVADGREPRDRLAELAELNLRHLR